MTDDLPGGLTPEQEARLDIDAQLTACGWLVQDQKSAAVAAAQGVAVREVPVGAGRADYVLFVDRQAVGVIEAKPVGTTLTGVETQTLGYQKSYPGELPSFQVGRGAAVRLRVHRRRDPVHLRVGSRADVAAGRRVSPARDVGPVGHRPRGDGLGHVARRPAGAARSRSPRPLGCPGQSDPGPGGVAAGEPAACVDPDGDGRWQDVHRCQRHLPACATRRGAARAVPRRPGDPGRAGRRGVRGLRHARRRPQVHRAVQRAPAHLLASQHGRRGGRQGARLHYPAALLAAAGRGVGRSPRRAVRLRGGARAARGGGLQPGGAHRVLRRDRRRRVSPLHLRGVAAGAGVFRRLHRRPDRHAGHTDPRLLPAEPGDRVPPRGGGGRPGERGLRRVPDPHRDHRGRRHRARRVRHGVPRPPNPRAAPRTRRRGRGLRRRRVGPPGRGTRPDPHDREDAAELASDYVPRPQAALQRPSGKTSPRR